MKFNVIALAGALLALTAAAAQASPASVIPDTAHAIVRGTGQIVGGTVEGVGNQVKHDYRAGARTTHDVVHGTVPRHWRHRHHHYHHHYYHHRVTRTETVQHEG